MAASGDNSRFVLTKEIGAAVNGRESDILDALSISWRNGNPHIGCPYPDHADNNPSWRWDARRSRALCTCIAKSDGIFDVVMKVEGLDFPTAKIRVAELIGRPDLIRTTTGAGGQKTDPVSLLSPKAADRDDGLVLCYLAARLGLADPATAPLPSARTAGWRSLAYYDPPEKKGAKPKLIASPPCAVFETTAADGRRHAHRIYLSDDGRGTAALGTVDSKPRDAKKSARLPIGAPSTAGCCVVWGNPDTEHVALAEGIETAAAIACAFRGEIGRGELAVLAAISAGGVEAFAPWPTTRKVTVCADRDEAKPGAGLKRGERAARTFAIRQFLGDSQ